MKLVILRLNLVILTLSEAEWEELDITENSQFVA
jgi:hypothetical protein